MHRSKLGLLGLCIAALSLMAFSASSASAAEWLILNSNGEVKTGTELNAFIVGDFEPEKDGTLLTHLLKLFIGILCTKFTLTNAKLVGGGGVSSGGKVTFTGCIVKNEATHETLPCTVNSIGAEAGTIESKEGKGQLQSSGETLIESLTEVEEEGKKVGEFAELKFEGSECVLKPQGTVPVKGVLWIKDCEGKVETHLVKHLIEESKAKFRKNKAGLLTLGTLWLGANTEEHLETSVDGSAFVFLSGEHATLAWGATLP